MLATLLLSGIGGDLNIQISTAAFNMAKPVIVLLVTTVLPMMMTITLVFTIARGYLNSASLQIDLAPLIRMLLVGVLLIFYRSYVPMVGDSVHWLAKTITGTASNAQAYATLEQLKPPVTTPQPTPQQIAQGQVDEPSAIMSLANQIGDKLSAISTFSIQDWIMELATGLIAQLIQVVFLFVQAFLTGFLFVVGPIAITLSVLPGWGGLIKSWFQSFLSVQMWTLAFSIINALFANYSQAQAAVMATQYNSVNDYFAAHASQAQYQVGCIVFIVMYLMVPYMTSLIVGHAATDSFMGSAARMISHAAGPVGKAAGAAAGLATEAANSGKSILGGMSSMFGGAGGGGGGGAATTEAAGAGGAIPKMMSAGSRITTPSRMLGGGTPAMPSMGSVLSSQGGSGGSNAGFVSPAYGGSGTGDFAGSGSARGASGAGSRILGTGDPAAKAVGAARAQSSGSAGGAGESDIPPLGAASGSWGQPLPDSGGPNMMINFSSRDGILRGIAPDSSGAGGAESGSSASAGRVSAAPTVRQLSASSASTEADKKKAAADAALPPLLVPPALGGSGASW